MNNIYNLIKNHGLPNAIIDHWDINSKRYAIWGFEEEFHVDYYGRSFINGKQIPLPFMPAWQETLNKWKSDNKKLSAIGYISYDMKNLFFQNIKFKNATSANPLMWFGKPKLFKPFCINKNKINTSPFLSLVEDIPDINDYKFNIAKIKRYLKRGNSYQINFTQPKKYNFFGNPLLIYLKMRDYIQPHYGMFLDLDNFTILSFSPERFFNTHSRTISSLPMKGTRKRSSNIAEDEKLFNELYNSPKDRAEHLMIVDLIRNDIGKICDFGSVKVNNLYSIQSFNTVHQMVSEVYGNLKKDTTESDIIKALFPGGSITGAPKEESMKIIDELENYNRGVYTGTLGYIENNGNMDFNIAIRTMSLTSDLITYPVGGGIVWDSIPSDEWQEAQQKSKILNPFIFKNKSELLSI